MIGIGVIGYGYWGPNLVRNFHETPGASVVGVSDLRPERLAHVGARYPGVRVTTDYHDLLADPAIDAVAIATPVASHYPLALEALQASKHVLVEKPLAATSEQAMHLIEEAAGRQRVLMVDHTYVYAPAVRKIRELVDSHALGEIYYYDSTRVNLGLFQKDVNVLWDLAVHDLAIMDFVLPERPIAVSATGIGHITGKPENLANITLFFASHQIAHVHVNWLAPVKLRQILIGGSKRMIVYDDVEPSEKVKVYDKGVDVSHRQEDLYELLVNYRSGDMWAPHLDTGEALRAEAAHLLECIAHGSPPLTDGYAGLRVVQILEAAGKSLQARGSCVELSPLEVTA
jgi:predicted dehydrogenase